MVEVNRRSFQLKFGNDSPNGFETLCISSTIKYRLNNGIVVEDNRHEI